jgi:hypothetical protein
MSESSMVQSDETRNAEPLVYWYAECFHEHRLKTSIGAVLVISALAAATGAIHARHFGHDIFFLLDNGWRALHGQRVHVDYSSAWGPVTFLLVAAGLAVSGGSVAAVSYANAIAAFITGSWSALLIARKSRTLTAVIYPAFVALFAAAPFAVGESPVLTSHGMVYNRYGYTLLAVIMLECFALIRADSPVSLRSRTWQSGFTGCAVALLLFLKITFFGVALVFLGTSLFFWEGRRWRAVAYAAGFALTTVTFLAYLRFDVGAVISDLAMVAAARRHTLGWGHNIDDVLYWAVTHLISLGLLAYGCARLSRTKEASSLSVWRYPIAAAVVVGTDIVLLFTNAQANSFPLSAFFAILLLLLVEPAMRSSAPLAQQKKAALLLILAAVLAGPVILEQTVGLGYALVQSKANPNPAGVLRFDSAKLRPLVLYDLSPNDIDRFSNGRQYVASINDGIQLLSVCTVGGEKVTTLDLFNPFAYALGRDPINGGIAAAAYRYFLDDQHHPSPERLFGDASVVMVPKYPAGPPLFYDGFFKIYEPALERDFRLQVESSRWRLYRRNTEIGAAAVLPTPGCGSN